MQHLNGDGYRCDCRECEDDSGISFFKGLGVVIFFALLMALAVMYALLGW